MQLPESNNSLSSFVLPYKNIKTSIQQVIQPVNIDLTLSDVASEIRNRMGDIVIGHSQDWNLGTGGIQFLEHAIQQDQ